AVGLVMLLVADESRRDEAAREQPRQFAMHGADSHAGQPHDLVGVEAARRIAVEQPEHALLRAGEQCVGDRGRRLSSHLGNDSSQIGTGWRLLLFAAPRDNSAVIPPLAGNTWETHMKRKTMMVALALAGFAATTYSTQAAADPVLGALVGAGAGAALGGPPGAAGRSTLGPMPGGAPAP